MRRFPCDPWLVFLPFVLFLAAIPASAGEPNLSDVNLRGLRIGATTTLVCRGEEFGAAPRLLLPFAARVELKPGGTAGQATFDVMLAGDVAPGYYNVRVLTAGGVSQPLLIGVDGLPQVPLTPAISELPAAVSGAIGGSTVAETAFEGKAGESVLIELEAQRLGSKLRPVVHVYNARRRQLAWSWVTPSLLGDTRVEVTLPEAGQYTVALHDAEYSVPGPGFFRLKIGRWSYVDQVFPPSVGAGQTVSVELLGSAPTSRLDFSASGSAGPMPLPWPAKGLWSGPRPIVLVSLRAETIEQASPGGVQELPAGTVAVSGRLLAPFEEDRYRVAVTPKSRLRLEAFAERLGAPLDAALVVRNEQGDVLARAEESAGTVDPVLDYAVPDGMNSVIVGVIDVQGRGGPRGVYRLAVDPQGMPADQAPFKLSTVAQRVTVPAGGRAVVPILIERRGSSGPVELVAAGFSDGFRFENGSIPEGAEGALVSVERGEAGDAAITTWRGRAANAADQPIVVQGHPLQRLQPWLAEEIAVAPSSARAADFSVEWRELAADAALFPATKLSLPIKIIRSIPAGDTSIIRLTLTTSQGPRLLNGQPDAARLLRQEQAVQLPAGTLEGTVTAIAPADLAAPVYDVAIQAELATADGKTVLARAWTPFRRLPVRPSVELTLAGPPRLEAVVDSKTGATVMIAGKVERRGGFAGPVALSLAGLPAGARADAVTVKADASDFTINLILPANQAAGEIKGVKLSAAVTPDPGRPDIRFRSPEVELTLNAKVASAN